MALMYALADNKDRPNPQFFTERAYVSWLAIEPIGESPV
jgi:hypothetical protein